MTCTCREVHWLDSSFSSGFGWLFRVPGGSFSPESSCEHSSSSKHRFLIVVKHQCPCWVFVTAGLSYLKTGARRRGRTEQRRPCWVEDGSGCCSDFRGSQRGVWEEEAGPARGRPKNWWRRNLRTGKERARAEGGWKRRVQWGRSAYLWHLKHHKRTTKTRWHNFSCVLSFIQTKQRAPPLSL